MTLFSDAFWRHDDWTVRLGIRWTELENDLNGSGFYSEFVPSWGISKNIAVGENSLLVLGYDGAWFISENDTFSFVRDDLNDRVTNSVTASLIHRFNRALYVEPYARLSYAVYSNEPSGDREDVTLNLGLTASYYLRDNIALRFFTNYQDRNSSGAGIVDYENLDLGIGSSLTFSF